MKWGVLQLRYARFFEDCAESSSIFFDSRMFHFCIFSVCAHVFCLPLPPSPLLTFFFLKRFDYVFHAISLWDFCRSPLYWDHGDAL